MSDTPALAGPMTSLERRATLSLAGVFALRMFGMFLVLPVFVLYADGLPGVTPLLAGLALGIYGLTQGVLQIPFGWMSDRYGRKRVIAAGLLVFAAGSVVAATAPDIWWTIAGRALQGAGAVAAAMTALLADLTRDSVRTRAMAVIGVTIGGSFALSLIFGPLLDAWIGVRGIFWLTAAAALLAIAMIWLMVPESGRSRPEGRSHEGRSHEGRSHEGRSHNLLRDIRVVAGQRDLRRLDAGIFTLHFVLTACFVALPPALAALPELAGVAHARVYLPVLAGSALLMLPLVLVGDRPVLKRPLQLGTIALLGIALLGMAVGHGGWWPLLTALLAFFTAFNFLEASLPARVAQVAGGARRGAALGVYSSCQFLGTFAGGLAGGALYGIGGPALVFGAAALAAGAWLAMAARK